MPILLCTMYFCCYSWCKILVIEFNITTKFFFLKKECVDFSTKLTFLSQPRVYVGRGMHESQFTLFKWVCHKRLILFWHIGICLHISEIATWICSLFLGILFSGFCYWHASLPSVISFRCLLHLFLTLFFIYNKKNIILPYSYRNIVCSLSDKTSSKSHKGYNECAQHSLCLARILP